MLITQNAIYGLTHFLRSVFTFRTSVSWYGILPGTCNLTGVHLRLGFFASVVMSCEFTRLGQVEDLPLPRAIRTFSEHGEVISTSPWRL